MAIQISKSDTRDGTVYTGTIPGGPGVADRRAAALVRDPAIEAELARVGGRLAVLSETYTDAALPGEIRKEMRGAYRLLGQGLREGTSRRREATKRMREQLQIPDTVSRDWFRLTVDRVLQLEGRPRMDFLKSCGMAELAAMVDAGNGLLGLPPHEWDVVIERATIAFFAERQGLAARFPLKPTLDNLFAIGPDTAAVEDAARAAFDGAKEASAAIDADEASLRQVIVLVALMTDQKPADVLALALGEDRPALAA